ncbi:MAG TPA: hypothetical protein VFD70_15315 [Anaerolineae bacterium]|nr:hypothetical protein [Anaerolineae bacterium]
MNKTRIALLGTLADLHAQPIRYDLAELERIVATTQPDLLGVEIERDEFERNDFVNAPLEVRDALIPLARKTDMVIVPLGAMSRDELLASGKGWLLDLRTALIRALEGLVPWIQTTASDARTINSALVCHTCGWLCDLEAMASGAAGRRAWAAANDNLLTQIVSMARHDPNTRILVAVQCRRKHWLDSKLRRMADVELVNYWEL